MLQLRLQPPRFTPLPRRRVAGGGHHRRRRAAAPPPPLALRSQWRIPDVDADAVQERVRSWLSRARGAIADAANAAREKGRSKEEAEGRKKRRKEALEEQALVAVPEITVERRVGRGWLSLDAVVTIEQFARLNGLTGRKVQRIFEALAPSHVQNDARNLVEYCCFRYLSRDNSDLHPSLKELAFQRLIFMTMLAWEDPYGEDDDTESSLDNYSILGRLVGEDAFVRIAPAVAGVADVSTAHYLFRALVGSEKGLSLDIWTTYLGELLKVHHGRQTHKSGDHFLSDEQVLCIGSSRKRPVLKWEENTAWPGHLTLTNKALYFEAIGLTSTNKPLKLDLTDRNSRVEKAKVGPFGSRLFDSAVSVSSGSVSNEWTLEFVDFGGEMRRDVWLAFISEIISVYRFINEYGPRDDDPAIHHVYGAHRGKKRAAMVACKEKSKIVERTQATIVAATIEGIPSNIDLFKELILPFAIVSEKFYKLKRWENPRTTACFLLVVYTIIFRNMLSYVLPFSLMMLALSMLALKGLKEQGRLGRSFGKVTIKDQPPSNTIQKIIALKEAMASVENYLQNLNLSLLKIRTIFLAGQPEVTTQVALVLLASSAVLLVVPFKYVLAFFMFDQFTRELEFRREMVKAFMSFMKERWESIHAAPVVVLPYEDGGEQHNKTLPPKSTQQTQSGSVQSTDTYMNLSNGTYTLDI
ncbi:hypothetical protein OsI_04580 [Oryza sativa Indica Group]|uniref:Uncharacterized protein n=1 Tax=Oryza sativa subsp. indica TaxID=39946 RepID=B8A6Y7_ORYSI|nr:hypothetical protein OsI_04580 [Oryza sativa Indica Group]